jgi:hypothetical protein
MMFFYGYYTVGSGADSIEKTDEDSGTPMLQIGKCSEF